MGSYRAVVATAHDGDPRAPEAIEVSFHSQRTALAQTFSIDAFTGGHLLHLAIAGCVFNDLLREARTRGITLTRVLVTADGGFDGTPCESTGIGYTIDLEGAADEQELRDLVAYVEDIAEIPSAVRKGADVRLTRADIAVAPN